MPLVAAKCTQCGSALQVDDSKEAGICIHCGTAFITEKAVNNYNITHNYNTTHNTNTTQNITKIYQGNVVMGGEADKCFDELMAEGQKLLELDRQKQASKVFEKATFLEPKNWQAWFGYAKAGGEWTKIDGNDDYDDIPAFEKAFKLAPDNKATEQIVTALLQTMGSDFNEYSGYFKLLKQYGGVSDEIKSQIDNKQIGAKLKAIGFRIRDLISGGGNAGEYVDYFLDFDPIRYPDYSLSYANSKKLLDCVPSENQNIIWHAGNVLFGTQNENALANFKEVFNKGISETDKTELKEYARLYHTKYVSAFKLTNRANDTEKNTQLKVRMRIALFEHIDFQSAKASQDALFNGIKIKIIDGLKNGFKGYTFDLEKELNAISLKNEIWYICMAVTLFADERGGSGSKEWALFREHCYQNGITEEASDFIEEIYKIFTEDSKIVRGRININLMYLAKSFSTIYYALLRKSENNKEKFIHNSFIALYHQLWTGNYQEIPRMLKVLETKLGFNPKTIKKVEDEIASHKKYVDKGKADWHCDKFEATIKKILNS